MSTGNQQQRAKRAPRSKQFALKQKTQKQQKRPTKQVKNSNASAFSASSAPEVFPQSLHQMYTQTLMGSRKGSRNGGTMLQPPRRTVRMRWANQYSWSAAAGSNSWQYYFTPNAIYTVDPTLGASITTPALSSMAALYSYYRVRSYRGKITFATAVALEPITTIVIHSNTSLGTVGGDANFLKYAELAKLSKRATTRLINGGTAGPSVVTHSFSHSVADITGESVMQDNYKSAVNGVPTTLIYVVAGIFGEAAFGAGQTADVLVEFDVLVDFIDYVDTLTSYSDMSQPIQPYCCAGCTFLRNTRSNVCPCGTQERCTNCNSSHPCTILFPLKNCPRQPPFIPVHTPIQRTLSQNVIEPPSILLPYTGCSSRFLANHQYKKQQLLESPKVELESTKIWSSSKNPSSKMQ